MIGHGEWFKEMQTLEKPGYVETREDTTHAIVHTGNVPLTMQDGKVKYLSDVLHVPSITKNLVLVGQMVEQGLQVRFTPQDSLLRSLKKMVVLLLKGKRLAECLH